MARAGAEMDHMLYDDAIKDFDRALVLEPYFDRALVGRGLARYRKYRFMGHVNKNGNVEWVVGEEVKIPQAEADKICVDLGMAVYMGEKDEMVNEIITELYEMNK